MDTDNDNQLSSAELSAQLSAGEGEGEGEGGGTTPTTGCPASKADFVEGIQKAMGDLFLFGVALMTLFAFGGIKR